MQNISPLAWKMAEIKPFELSNVGIISSREEYSSIGSLVTDTARIEQHSTEN